MDVYDVRTRVVIVCVVVLVALAGCFGTELTGGDGEVGDLGPENPGDAASKEAQTSEETNSLNASAQRSVIRNGTIHSQVPDFDNARQNRTSMIREQGGYVSDSTEHMSGPNETHHTSGRIVYPLDQPPGEIRVTATRNERQQPDTVIASKMVPRRNTNVTAPEVVY